MEEERENDGQGGQSRRNAVGERPGDGDKSQAEAGSTTSIPSLIPPQGDHEMNLQD